MSTTLNSGTVAGALQLLAYIPGSDSIFCAPIPIAIHSGFPDASHFAVFPLYINFPGFSFFGRVDSIKALVGDMYANPVPQGTAVYFSTDAGIIEGSATTDSAGFATVRLFSGPPTPPATNPLGIVTAQTVGQGGQILSDSASVLFSGISQIYDLSPTDFSIADGGSQTFEFRLSDQNGFPLAHDTHILIESTAGGVLGDVDVVFPDTQSLEWTYFSFVLFDNNPNDADPPVIAAVSIYVSSPNGDASLIITGTMD
ncbi:MAG: Ig-like domain-containing protein [bacterium]